MGNFDGITEGTERWGEVSRGGEKRTEEGRRGEVGNGVASASAFPMEFGNEGITEFLPD